MNQSRQSRFGGLKSVSFSPPPSGGRGRLTLEGPRALDTVGSHTQVASSSVGLNNYSMRVVTEGFAIGVAMTVHLQLSLWRRLSLLV